MSLQHIFEGSYSLSDLIFEKERRDKNLTRIMARRWVTEATTVEQSQNAIYREELLDSKFEEIRSETDSISKVSLDKSDGYVHIHIAASDIPTANNLLEEYGKEFPLRPVVEGRVPITFWANTPRGPRAFNREISAQPWNEVQRNYPSDLQEELDKLINEHRANAEGGKLILFSGPAGTGKTHFVRSLAMEWRKWTDMHYVVDSNEFFGGGAEYLFDVLMAGDTDKWKLIVCEDTGELLTRDAKAHTGQALSRFLNLCDGMIGQGLKIQILLTTNEEISKFHQAVVRPGRIAANLDFPPFPQGEASSWIGEPVNRAMTLAEMYAYKRGEEIPVEQRVGII